MQREVLAVLTVVAEIKVQVEAGRELTDREFRLTRECRDRAGREWVRFNRVCKEAERVWRPSLGKCIHVIAGLRR